jgi:hypothetical protein
MKDDHREQTSWGFLNGSIIVAVNKRAQPTQPHYVEDDQPLKPSSPMLNLSSAETCCYNKTERMFVVVSRDELRDPATRFRSDHRADRGLRRSSVPLDPLCLFIIDPDSTIRNCAIAQLRECTV